jgi:CRISPR-associated endonuclease/helicase Cas3
VSEPLAHSARDGAPEQTYREHVGEVIRLAMEFGRETARFSPKWRDRFLAALEMAATYHDLGKLDEIFQDDLRKNRRQTRLNHVDAGVAHLLKGKHAEAVIAAYAHHIGLPSLPEERAKNANGIVGMFRDLEKDAGATGWKTYQRSDAKLAEYLAEHARIFAHVNRPTKAGFTSLVRRLLLSCLVDADHSDTARHYGNERPVESPPLLAADRLAALDRYVAALAAKASPQTDRERYRQQLRQQVYRACRERPVKPDETILSCDSPVGTGKTTAVMAHLLRVAAERGLRRVFVVLPFTNIIDQSVDVYRRALRLPGETEAGMEAVVAAHHHRVDYSGERIEKDEITGVECLVLTAPELRQLAARWDSPIVVTTAVQFFETLAAKDTAPLRKLHQVAGSAIFVDEAHAAMPAALWPQMFRWLCELCDDWSCHLVLASGSLTRFWELEDFVPASERRLIPELVPPDVANRTKEFEERRVQIRTHSDKLSLQKLAEFVLGKPGPRLVILNTVQSAAVLANHLREECKLGLNVEHISTALTPSDRAKTVRRVRERLASPWKNWCLVATSCVEAGVDFSFRSAFRESWGLVNLLQIAGRASRSGEYPDTEVWDFRHDESGGLSLHPQAKVARGVLADIFKVCAKQQRQPSPNDCTEALRLELRNDRGAQALRIEEIERAEKEADYPEVAKLCRIITADTRTVLVDRTLIERIESRDRAQFPSWREIMQGSVQIWSSRLDPKKWPVKPIGPDGELWAMIEGNYDAFLGYMAGILPLLKAGQTGFEPL